MTNTTAPPAGAPRTGLSNLTQRVLTALVVAPAVIGLLWLGDWWFAGFVLLASGLAAHEWLGMCLSPGSEGQGPIGLHPVPRAVATLLAVGLCFAATQPWFGAHAFLLLTGGALLVWVSHLLFPGPIPGSFGRASLALAGVLYAGLLPACLLLLRALPQGFELVLLCMLLAFLSDTFAYFAGRFLGRRKLYPAVSPGKTWAGAAGGLLGAMATCLVASLTFLPGLPWPHALLMAVPAGVLAQVGDLTESLLKRSVGVKDSGRLFPGHGGMLDRIDALLFAAPAMLAYLTLVLGWGAR
jgi:phosphatidate cytidylyltransferase